RVRRRRYRDARRVRVGDRRDRRRADPVSDHAVQSVRGTGNSLQILAHLCGGRLLYLRLELIGGGDDGAYGPGRLGAEAAQIDLIVLARAPEDLIDEQHQLLRILVQFTQPGLHSRDASFAGALQQHLAVTDDVVQRRVQLMPQMIQCRAIGGHAAGPWLSRLSIFPNSRGSSIGLVSKSSHPTASALARSLAMV